MDDIERIKQQAAEDERSTRARVDVLRAELDEAEAHLVRIEGFRSLLDSYAQPGADSPSSSAITRLVTGAPTEATDPPPTVMDEADSEELARLNRLFGLRPEA